MDENPLLASSCRCVKCKEFLKDSFQDQCCGNRFCGECILVMIRDGLKLSCETCKKVIELKGVVDDSNYKCNNEGCTWTGSVQYFKAHIINCCYSPIKCVGCGDKYSPESIGQHRLSCVKFDTFDSQCEVVKWTGIEEVSRIPTSFHVETLLRSLQEKIGAAARVFADFKTEIKDSLALTVDTIHQNTGANPPLMEPLERNAFTDGILRWTVVDFTSRMRLSRNGELSSIYSHPFYTRNKYKFRLRLDINGREDGFNSHMSLYLINEQGDNDHQLNWPLRINAITFKLLNVEDKSDFTREVLNVAFNRPLSDLRCELECGKCGRNQFISQEQVQCGGFILNGAIFLICQVELA